MADMNDYPHEMTEAAHSVLLEIVRLLGEYRDDMRIIGGWVTELLVSGDHIGSADVDILLNHLVISEECYRTIEELLLSRGYERGGQPYVFFRKVIVGGRETTVHVDFLAGEYGGTTRKHRHQKVQEGFNARKARGADLAFEMYEEITLEGILPGGGRDTARVRVARMVPFIIMKAMAMQDRLKEKDIAQRDAFELMRYFLTKTGFIKDP